MIGAVLDAPSRVLPTDRLSSVDVYITAQCNRRCAYCFLPAEFFASHARMTMSAFSGVLTWSQQNEIREITLLGGEASLHPNFAEMVSASKAAGFEVRVVTNGARSFRRLLQSGQISPHNLDRVAISLDSVSEQTQDALRGDGSWRDARATIDLLRGNGVLFDINVTAVSSVLPGIQALIDYAEFVGARRVNIHWPSAMGLGRSLPADEIPAEASWRDLTASIAARKESRPGFFVEIERGFLDDTTTLAHCALADYSNLQILPDGTAYRCGLLVDRPEMASLSMRGDQLLMAQPGAGEELVRTSMSGCESCPVVHGKGRRACIFDKLSSQLAANPPAAAADR